MKAFRSMVLVSSDPHQYRTWTQMRFIKNFNKKSMPSDLQDEISLTMVGDVGQA